MSDSLRVAEGWKVLDDMLLYNGRKNGERVRKPAKNRMTKDEVRVTLKALFNITDELSVDVVWEHMLEVWRKHDAGE